MFANTPEYGDLLLEGLRDIFSARSNDELVGKLRDTSKKSIPLQVASLGLPARA